MEMSSPTNKPDDDIDIDFGDYTGDGQLYDDHMIEDGQTRPGTATDDTMEDDSHLVEQALVQEEVMQDGDVQDAPQFTHDDDELIDYGDEEYQEDFREDATITGVSGSQHEQVGHADANAPDFVVGEVAQAALNTRLAPDVSSPVEVLPPSSVAAEEIIYDEAGNDTTLAVVETAALDAEEHGPVEGRQEELQLNTAVESAATPDDNTPGTPTDTGLHPMTVRYGDLNIPLFKSRRQPDGLLKDDNIASLSLAELMKNCRQRLAIKIGEDLSEDQELHLGFDRLGLLLVEDSRMAFESSLNDILEVYLQLQRNDGLDEIPPLSLTLSLQLKFASSLSILKQAAASGQGMSNFGFLNAAESEEYYQEQYELGENAEFAQDDYAEEELHEQDVTDTADGDHPEGEQAIEDYQEHDDTGEDHSESEEAYYHDDAAHRQDEHAEEDDDQAPPGIETLLQGEQQPAPHDLYNAPHDPAETGHQTDDTSVGTRISPADQQPGQAASTTSSATAEHVAGIDHSIPTAAEQEDFSSFLAELGDEDVDEDSTARGVKQVLSGGDAAVQDGTIPADEHTAGDEQQDVSGNATNHADDAAGQYQDLDDEDQEPGEEEGDEEAAENDPADTFVEQYKDSHLEHEPDADRDHFNDFSNGDLYEHGPEHDIYDEGEEGLDDTVETVVHHAVDEHGVPEDFEDAFDFDESSAPTNPGNLHQSGSLSGKRSFGDFDEHDDFHFADEDRDSKKARSG